MALWGNNDNKLTATVGLVTASGINGQVTGTGTTFTNFAVGDTLTLGVGATSGFGVIKNIDSDTSMQVITTAMDPKVGIYSGPTKSYTVGQRPVALREDPNFAPTSSNAERDYTSKVYGVNASIQDARKASGSQYAPTHAGWVGVTTYNDTSGNLRVKTETFVAMSGISTQTQAPDNVLPA
tara:strand:+ start:479 stop:1021 length:543 start_codon:yes stop_codon:yes gene_type:complete